MHIYFRHVCLPVMYAYVCVGVCVFVCVVVYACLFVYASHLVDADIIAPMVLNDGCIVVDIQDVDGERAV